MTPGRKLQVTVTVPEGFSKLLVVEGLTVNGTPVPTCSGCGVRVEEGARFCEVCRLEEPQQDKVPPGTASVPPGQCPRSAPAPPQGAPGGWAARQSQEETEPLSAQPLLLGLELAASKAADLAACDHAGVRTSRDARTGGGLRQRSGHCRRPQGERGQTLTLALTLTPKTCVAAGAASARARPEWSNAVKWAALEAASSSPSSSGWAPSGPASSWECRAAKSRQARPEEAQEPTARRPLWSSAAQAVRFSVCLSV